MTRRVIVCTARAVSGLSQQGVSATDPRRLGDCGALRMAWMKQPVSHNTILTRQGLWGCVTARKNRVRMYPWRSRPGAVPSLAVVISCHRACCLCNRACERGGLAGRGLAGRVSPDRGLVRRGVDRLVSHCVVTGRVSATSTATTRLLQCRRSPSKRTPWTRRRQSREVIPPAIAPHNLATKLTPAPSFNRPQSRRKTQARRGRRCPVAICLRPRPRA